VRLVSSLAETSSAKGINNLIILKNYSVRPHKVIKILSILSTAMEMKGNKICSNFFNSDMITSLVLDKICHFISHAEVIISSLSSSEEESPIIGDGSNDAK
jgi:hypothetical protein